MPSALAKAQSSSPSRRCRCLRIEGAPRKTAWSESGCPAWRGPTLGCLPRRRWDSPSPAWSKGCSQRCHGSVDKWESWDRGLGAPRSDAYRLRRTELHEESCQPSHSMLFRGPVDGDGGTQSAVKGPIAYRWMTRRSCHRETCSTGYDEPGSRWLSLPTTSRIGTSAHASRNGR